MNVDIEPDGSIRSRDRLVFLRRALLFLAAVCVALAAATLILATGESRSALGELGTALFCGVLAAVLQDSEFEFDAARREVRWRKRRLFAEQGGTIPFDDIQDVSVEIRSSRSDSGLSVSLDCRVFLITASGRLPLGSSNLDVTTAREKIAVPLLELLGKGDRPPLIAGLTSAHLRARR